MNCETREEKIARLERELAEAKAELDARWWEPWFTEDPMKMLKLRREDWAMVYNIKDFMKEVIPTIIRKREKVGAVILKGKDETCVIVNGQSRYYYSEAVDDLIRHISGRTIEPGDKVEI